MEPLPPFPAPSSVRILLRAQHEELRVLLLEADRLGKAVCDGYSSQVGPLRAVAEAVARFLAAHIDDEERLALPHLRELDAWGPMRARMLEEEHQAQRAQVATLLRLEQSGETAELARGLRALAQSLFEDMRREDRELLAEHILRDDVVSVDQTDG